MTLGSLVLAASGICLFPIEENLVFRRPGRGTLMDSRSRPREMVGIVHLSIKGLGQSGISLVAQDRDSR